MENISGLFKAVSSIIILSLLNEIKIKMLLILCAILLSLPWLESSSCKLTALFHDGSLVCT